MEGIQTFDPQLPSQPTIQVVEWVVVMKVENPFEWSKPRCPSVRNPKRGGDDESSKKWCV